MNNEKQNPNSEDKMPPMKLVSYEPKTQLEEKKVDINITREKLALCLLAIFTLTISLSFIAFFIDPDNKNSNNNKFNDNRAKDFSTLIITAQVGLIGSALGFYFGEKK